MELLEVSGGCRGSGPAGLEARGADGGNQEGSDGSRTGNHTEEET